MSPESLQKLCRLNEVFLKAGKHPAAGAVAASDVLGPVCLADLGEFTGHLELAAVVSRLPC